MIALFAEHPSQYVVQANLDMADSMDPGKLGRHMQNPSYTYDAYFFYILVQSTTCCAPDFYFQRTIYITNITNEKHILDIHGTGTKHIVRHSQKSVLQWSVISKFTCIHKMTQHNKNISYLPLQ